MIESAEDVVRCSVENLTIKYIKELACNEFGIVLIIAMVESKYIAPNKRK